MSGGSNSLKPGQPRSTNINTVQTLLKAKLGSTKEKAPKKGRTHSQLSNDSNNSIEFDLSGLDHIQKDLEEIKSSLQGVTKITDLNEATKDLVKSTELETLVTVIVNKLLNNFESKLETKFETKLTQVTNNMQEKIDALSMENENLKGQLDATKNVLGNVKTTLNRNVILTKDATIQSNYNEQYSRKNNIKVFNMKKRDKQNLREDFIDLVKKDLNVDLELRDVVAIHRLPSDRPGEKPIIVRLFNSDAKRNVMRAKKNLKNNVRFVDDITKQNHELMKRMRDSNRFDSVWFYNCGIYGRTPDDKQFKFGLYDDIDIKIRQRR